MTNFDQDIVNEKITKKKRILPYILFVISVIFSVLAFELFLIFIKYPYQNCKEVYRASEYYFGQYDSLTGWSYRSNFSFIDPLGEYEYHFDEYGNRAPSANYKMDKTKPRIIFVGDSLTFGEGLNFKDTYPSRINELLNDKFEIINLGVQGFGSAQSMLRLKEIINEVKPEFVVYTFIPDHINRDNNYDRRLHVDCFSFAGTKPVFNLENNDLKQIYYPKQYEEVDRIKLSLLFSNVFQVNFEKKMKNTGKDVAVTKEIVKELKQISQAAGAKNYFIYYDTTYNLSTDNYNYYLLQNIFNEEEGSKVLDFTNWATDSVGKGKKYYINDDDDYHPNSSISSEIANKFVEKFGEELSNYQDLDQ
jgi:hypothetical protein